MVGKLRSLSGNGNHGQYAAVGPTIHIGNAHAAPAGVLPTAPQHMYFLEGGLLVVSNLLKTDAWVHDGERSHCNVCVQQFMPFRRRHHCRTCGEVVCGHCSSQRKIHLTEVNVECQTRVCSFCMIRATDASINANEAAMRASVVQHKRASIIHEPPPLPPRNTRARPQTQAQPPNNSAVRPHSATTSSSASTAATTSTVTPPRHPGPAGPRAGRPVHQPVYQAAPPGPPRVSKQYSMLSIDSELTDGSVVQLWPNPVSDNETARLQIARNSTIRAIENDPTMNLLVSILSRTLECPVAFIGILEDHYLWFKATVGWDRSHILREDCVCALQEKTMIVADTNVDKHFHANTLTIGANPMRYYAGAPIRVLGQCIGAVSAIDIAPHWETSASMKSTLEAVANIVSEVLEQRVDGTGRSTESLLTLPRPSIQLTPNPVVRPTIPSAKAPMASSLPTTQSLSSCGSESTLVDFSDSLKDLHLIESSFSSLDSDEESEVDDDDIGRQTASVGASVHPWPAQEQVSSVFGGPSKSSMPRFSLAVPVGPPEVGEKVGKAMEFFQLLQSSRWTAGQGSSDIMAFDLFNQGRHFTKSHAKVSGDCTHVIAHLQTYDDARLYSDLFSRVTQRRQKINILTWVDHVQYRPGFEAAYYSEVKVMSHWRQYPDGSNVIVAFNDTNPELLMVEDFLFGWFISPSSPDANGNCVNISSIVAQPNENQGEDRNLSLQLIQRLQHSLPFHYQPAALASVPSDRSVSSTTSSDNQFTNDAAVAAAEANDTIALIGMRSRTSSCSAGDKMLSIRSKYNEVSSLNDNERMMLDLLDKTISTQEVLAAQQHVMANVMDYHGTQLERISSAIDRVETILHTNGDKLKKLNSERSNRHSISL